MKSWRIGLLAVLVLLPVLVMVGLGGWALWATGWLGWVWWLMPVCWGASWFLSRQWRQELVALQKFDEPIHWTPRDEQAQALIKARQDRVGEISPEKLVDAKFYFETSLEIAAQISKHYHPTAPDPVSALTLPEVLAAAQLASEDLELWVRQYVPGSHLVTIGHLRTLSKVPTWYNLASNLWWAVSMVADPFTTVPRYVASRTILSNATTDLQTGLLGAFYKAFIGRVGRYCIEMNSGRLRGGAALYREAMARLQPDAPLTPETGIPFPAMSATPKPSNGKPSTPHPSSGRTVTIALLGQVKAGKSSLVNALIGDQQAATDVLPLTRTVQRFRLLADAAVRDELVVLDTPGYAEFGATSAQLQEIQTASRDADLILLVADVKSPARKADLDFLTNLSRWFTEQPHFKPPPVLLVLTHIDGLSPVMEWAPPYNWQSPSRTKEQTIHEAVAYNSEQFGPLLAGVIPVCTDVPRNRVYGVQEWLLPAVMAALGEARATSVLRMLHRDLDSSRISSLFEQVGNLGLALIQPWLEGHPSSDASRNK